MTAVFRLICLLLLIGSSATAQFKLSGKIKDYADQELKINIPVVYGFHQQNSTLIAVQKDGSFAINLPIKEAKFANLIFQQKFFTLFLEPGKTLSVQINKKDTALNLLSGTSIGENKVMQAIDLEEYPFFMAATNQKLISSYTLDQLKSQVVNTYFDQRNNKINKVQSAAIPNQAKAVIIQELNAIAYNYLDDFVRTQLPRRSMVDSLLFYIFDQSNPKASTFPAGPQHYGFIENYVRYLENKSLHLMKVQKIPSNEPLPFIGISLDSAKVSEGKMSKSLWRANIAYKNLPPNVVEGFSYQQILNAFDYKELKQLEQLATVFSSRFPKSKYLSDVNEKTSILKAVLVANANNTAIQVIPNHEQLKSIYDVIKPYKGKVVYLDIWGTWCGPCKAEFQYNPELKEKFKGKDVIFLYLDMDEDTKDAEWREFIKVNSLTGVHFRRSRASIAPIWKELLANASDKAEYYPQYFIFDKEGKLVVTKANRPSSKDALYTQIVSYLN